MFELKQVNVTLGGKLVLDSVNLTLKTGGRTAVVGRSGSGKSTLLRLLCFMLRPDSGTVTYNSLAPGPAEITGIRRRLPMVHQEPLLWGGTVADNLTLPYTYASAGGTGSPLEDELAGLLEATRLDGDMLHVRADKLSGGEKQRVAIARALALRPEAILLDEPTSALDLITAEEVFDSIAEAFPELTIVLVTHSPSLVERCGRQILLEAGRVRASRDGIRADELRSFLETGE
ncbi:MAG: ATP-binding cassette domain-containing protein [Candidatus Glassbacteria bacterium]|nr:ATP-binding cassette domain-containing protein [Candidatus Glassbacteria bacterium]